MDAIAPLPVVIPLIVATLLVLLEKLPANRRILDIVAIATALSVLAMDLLLLNASRERTLVVWFGGWAPLHGFPVGIAFVIDPAAAWLAALTALLAAMGLTFSWHYFKAMGIFYHSLMLLFLGSMEGFCLTGDLFNMFVFFELMGVAAYSLTGYHIEDTGPLEGSLNFSVMNSLGAIFVLFGIAILYSKTGTLNLAQAGNYIAAVEPDAGLIAALALLTIGFLVKGAIVPFHFWLPDAHAVSPTPASVLFSGIMVELGLYAVARIYWTIFSGSTGAAPMGDLLVAAGFVTALAGAGMAFIQRHLKRMLAFSTVSHAGIILAGIGLLDADALGGTLLYIAGHGCVKGALFICAGIILHRRGSVDEELLRGRGRDMAITAAIFCTSGMALAGLPPFATFAGKALVEQAAAHLGREWLVPVFLAASALTGGTVLRAGLGIFFGLGAGNLFSLSAPSSGAHEAAETGHREKKTAVVMWLPALILLLLALAAGSIPRFAGLCSQAGAVFTDSESYRTVVLTGASGRLRSPPEVSYFSETVTGLAGAVLAIAVAFGALFSSFLPEKLLEGVRRCMVPAVSLLRTLHSGNIADYAAWLMAGAAVYLLGGFLSF